MTPARDIRVAIVEDQTEVREAWARLLAESPGFTCVEAVGTAEAALARFPALRPEVVLMDLRLPGMDGITCLGRLLRLMPDLHVLVVTVHQDAQRIFRALEGGAHGYLLKRARGEELLTAIRDVLAGGGPMSNEIARKVIQSFRRPAPGAPREVVLSAREEEVLHWLARGYTNKEIASGIGISPHTVSVHLVSIYDKIHVRSRAAATAWHLGRGGSLPPAPH